MNCAITYCSPSGNTKQLAEKINEKLSDNLYFGQHDDKALEADRLYIGFWTDKGTCDQKTIDFLSKVHGKEIFLFGTAGYGGEQEYFDKILERVKTVVPQDNTIIGGFMCQGKMPQGIRARYVKMKEENPDVAEKMDMMIENFDKALNHPNEQDENMLLGMI